MAAALLTRGFYPRQRCGEGAEGGGIRGPGLNKRSASILNQRKATLSFHVNFIHEPTAKCLRLSCLVSRHKDQFCKFLGDSSIGGWPTP